MCVYCENRLFVFVLVTIFKMDDVWHLYFFQLTSQLFHGEMWVIRFKVDFISHFHGPIISNDQKVLDFELIPNIYRCDLSHIHTILLYAILSWAQRIFSIALNFEIKFRSQIPNDDQSKWNLLRDTTLQLRRWGRKILYIPHSTFEWWLFRIKAIAWAFCVVADCDLKILMISTSISCFTFYFER